MNQSSTGPIFHTNLKKKDTTVLLNTQLKCQQMLSLAHLSRVL